MAGLLDFIQALREGADWAKRDIQKIGADPVASAKGAGTGFVKGVSTDLLGMPVDTGVNLYNLGKAGVGTVGGLFGMRPENLPVLTEKKDVPGSSEWLEEQVRKRGGGQFIDVPAGSSEIASLLGNVVAPGPKGAKSPKLEVMTYHGTPHTVDRYDLSRIGTGEGAQAYGHGMYFAENPQVAKEYQPKGWKRSYKYQGLDGTDWQMRFQDAGDYGRAQVWESIQLHVPKDRLLQTLKEEGYAPDVVKYASGLPKKLFAPPGGLLYKQDLPDEVLPSLLHWDRPLSEQSDVIKKALQGIDHESGGLVPLSPGATGKQIMNNLRNTFGESKASAILQGRGVPGLSYFDQGSREAGKGTQNHVIWDQSLLDRMLPQRVE